MPTETPAPERARVATGGGGRRPPPPPDRRREWWRDLPPPFNRPRPINRRNVLRGGLVAVPFLVLVDGLLGAMAWYATSNWIVGAAVFGVTFLFTLGEVAIVAWAAKHRQEVERRRSEER
jgi:type IV secretory pathway TrbD component